MLFISRKLKKMIPSLSQKHGLPKKEIALFLMGAIIGLTETQIYLNKMESIRFKVLATSKNIVGQNILEEGLLHHALEGIRKQKGKISKDKIIYDHHEYSLNDFEKLIVIKGIEVGSAWEIKVEKKTTYEKALEIFLQLTKEAEIYRSRLNVKIKVAFSELEELSRSWETIEIK